MSNNQIEQFFIDIKLNTAGVSKQAKQIDKMLNNLGKNSLKSTLSREKSKRAAYKKTYEQQKKYARDLRKLQREGKAGSGGGPPVPKPPKPVNNHPEKLKNDRLKAERDFRQHEAAMARQALADRLKEYKALKRKQEQLDAKAAKKADRINRQMDRIQSSGWYNNFKNNGGDTQAYERRLRVAMEQGRGISSITAEMRRLNTQQNRYNNSLRRTNILQRGVSDSARNMVRSYVSLYALFEGTNAIKRVGMEFQGMEAAMLAAGGSVEASAIDMAFINGTVDKMGLSLKDTTDAWVKFKFAAKGKISQGQQEDIFTGLSMFGTSLKVDSESMKRSQKALIQIDDYCLAA